MKASHINKNLLLKVMKVADIFEITITNVKEKPVIMLDASGKKYELTKSELVNNFTNLQGRKLRLISMKNNKPYLVAKLINLPCYAVKIPRGSDKQIELDDGRIVGAGKVIIVNENDLQINDGFIDINNGTVMSEALFRKTCILKEISIPLQQRLVKASLLKNSTANKKDMSIEQLVDKPVTDKTVTDKTAIDKTATDKPAMNTETSITSETTSKGSSEARIIKIFKQKGTDVVVAYAIQASDKVYTLYLEQAIIACEQHLISNATAVTNSGTGKKYLRGIGIKLEELPVEYI